MSNPAASIKEQNKSAASSLLRRNVRKFMNNKLALLGLVVVVAILLKLVLLHVLVHVVLAHVALAWRHHQKLL